MDGTGLGALVEELSAFPGSTGAALDVLVEADPRLRHELPEQRPLARALIGLLDLSRSISASLQRDPGLLDALREGVGARWELDAPSLTERFRASGATADDLRRFKRYEFIRIAARDVAGIADLPSAARELAALADVVVTEALLLAEPTLPLAIIGMGKLGGRELNYASDVDLVVVHDGDPQEAAKAVRRFLRVMTDRTAAGTIWRTDLDLRPEGPSGALSRTPASYGAYYRQWAQPWEYQALIKTRYVAGDVAVSNAYFDEIRPVVWGDQLPPGALDHIRAIKDRVEQRATAAVRQDVKRAPGGIRDVEFAVQLLQLVHGRNDPSIRSPSTLEALVQHVRAGHLTQADADRLDESYCYLRTVEHRLQLRDEAQTHDLPDDPDGLVWLARVLGNRQDDPDTAVAAFQRRHERRLEAVREIHARLFHRRTLEPVATATRIGEGERVGRLRALGFREPEEADTILGRLTDGLGPTSRLLRHLVPLLVEGLAGAPDPDLALVRLSWICDGPTRGPVIAAALRESPALLERLCRLLGSCGAASGILRRDPAAVVLLEPHDGAAPLELGVDAYEASMREGPEAIGTALRRDQLAVMIADVLDGADVRTVGRSLSTMADALLAAALAAAGDPPGVAVVGLGRLGGEELSYSSDLDVVFLAETTGADAAERATAAAKAIVARIHDPRRGGRLWEIDARLRPEGPNAPILTTLAGAAAYYRGRAGQWELQSMLRVRHVAGDADLTARFVEAIAPMVHPAVLAEEAAAAVRTMKRRIEQERCPQDDRRLRHLKLGPGGLSDVEFTVQLLQLQHGGADPAVRTPSTFDALDRLEAATLLSAPDTEALRDAYRLASRLRDRLFLERGQARDELPADPADLDVIAAALGVGAGAALAAQWTATAARCRAVVERVFYGTPAGQSVG